MDTLNSTGEGCCKIKNVVSANGIISPLLINVDRAFTEEELRNCECSWFLDEDEKSSRVIKFTDKINTYQGTTKTKGNIRKTVLVLQNKNTNKVQLVEMGECHLESDTQKYRFQSNYDNDEMDATYEENKSLLLKAFGSKRSKRASEVGSKMRINSDMMTSQIKESTADMTVDVKELELADSTLDTCMPLCHRDATSVQGVYPLQDFLTQKELDSLDDEVFTITTLMPFTAEESGYSQFFIDSLDRLQNKVNPERIKILLFIEALLRFFNLSLKKLKKTDLLKKISPFSIVIGKKIIQEFTVDSAIGRTRNLVMDDKIVIHIIVLVIIACDFVCNINELSKYLPRFNVVKMGEMARLLCLSSRDKVNWCLKLPLPPPRVVYRRRRT